MKILTYFSLAVFFFFVLDGNEVWAQSNSGAGQVIVKKWKDNKKAAFSFTFDDGLLTQYTNAWPILNQSVPFPFRDFASLPLYYNRVTGAPGRRRRPAVLLHR